MSDLYERSAAVMPPFALHKMSFGIDHAAGSYLYTDDGRKILDFGSGIAVNNLGHNYPTVVKAAQRASQTVCRCLRWSAEPKSWINGRPVRTAARSVRTRSPAQRRSQR